MLTITVPGQELWDEVNEEFKYTKDVTLQLEHSLVSLHKWESKWHKPFMTDKDKTSEEIIDYIRCMTITQNVPSDVYSRLTAKNCDEINAYIKNPMTATTFGEQKKETGKKEILTAEVIYYQMITLNIPVEFQKWHLNSLLTLIRVCAIKNQPDKKLSKQEALRRTATINAARRKKHV